jgi:4-alpha-glucanotransferase
MSTLGPSAPPFRPGYRASGALLHVTSLPLGPTGYCDSPYQCLSSFAGNELPISRDGLIDDGLLQTVDCVHDAFSPSTVEFEKVVPFKLRLLETAWSRFSTGTHQDLRPAYERFCHDHRSRVDDNPLLKRPLAKENIKPRLLRHWEVTPGLHVIYVHFGAEAAAGLATLQGAFTAALKNRGRQSVPAGTC